MFQKSETEVGSVLYFSWHVFPRENTFLFIPWTAPSPLIVKSSSLYRTTNITTLVKQNKKKKTKKPHTVLVMAVVLEGVVSCDPPAAGACAGSELEMSTYQVKYWLAAREVPWFTQHILQHTCKPGCPRAPCLRYQIKLSETDVSEEKKM